MRDVAYFFLSLGLLLLSGCSGGGGDDPPLANNTGDTSTLLQIHQIYLDNYLYVNELPTSLATFSGPADYVNFVNNQRPANDRFSSFLDPVAFNAFNEVIFQERALIGIQFATHTGIISESNPLIVESITLFSRGYYDGLQASDRLLEVDGIPVSGMTFDQVRELLPTLENEPVILRILRGTTEMTITTSSENSVELVLDPIQGIGYISLRTFSDDSLAFIVSDIQALQDQGVTRLILDVRANGGGSLVGVRNILNYFIATDGLLIYSVEDRNNARESQFTGSFTSRETLFDETNMVILADAASLSASEMLVNGLQFYQEATFIGTQTGGKGVAQSVFGLFDSSGTIVVSRRILGPDDDFYHLQGIAPDFVSTTPVTPTPGSDLQLQDAIDFLTTS